MKEWTSVVTDPLGLAGFALFLVFSVLSLLRRTLDARWVTASFVSLAGIALVGGLGLAYVRQTTPSAKLQETKPAPPVEPVEQTAPRVVAKTPEQVRQETRGAQSPAISNVQGNVTIIQGAVPEPPRKQPLNINGKWVSGTLINPYNSNFTSKLLFEFQLQGDSVLGTVKETHTQDDDWRYGGEYVVANGKIADGIVSFHTENPLNDGRSYKQMYRGTVQNDQIAFTRQNTRPSGGKIEQFTAKRQSK